MTSIFAVVLVLGGLIFFHELGHFSVARVFGIGVRTFSLGFGPKLFSFTGGKTEYRLSLVPLGGYVSMVGEQDDDDLSGGFTRQESFALRPAWQRMCIVAAGPLANFLLAFLIYWALFLSHGQFMTAPEIGGLREGSPAMAAGIQPGDTIVAISGKKIVYWTEVAETIGASEGREMTITLQREGKTLSLQVTPERSVRKTIFGEDEETFLIGIKASGKTINIPMDTQSAALHGLQQTWDMIALTGTGFAKLFQRVVPLDSVGGPIMIAQMVSQQAEQGISYVLSLAALISVNLGLLNLLPVPVLDGGHLVFFAIEAVRRKPVSARAQSIAYRLGVTCLLTLMIFATFNDVRRIFF